MTRRRASAGAAIVEYVAAIAAVGLLFLGLLVLRPHEVGRRDPVRAIPRITRLLQEPVRRLSPLRAVPARPRRPAVRRPRPPRAPVIIDLPEWMIGP